MLRAKLYKMYRFAISLLKLMLIIAFMSLKGRLKKAGFRFSIVSVFFYMVYDFLCKISSRSGNEADDLPDGMSLENSEADTSKDYETLIRPFKISITPEVLADLICRLKRTRFEDPLEDAVIYSGFNIRHLQKLTQYWAAEYQWRRHEQEINGYPNFKTNVEGIEVHFMHVKARPQKEGKLKSVPILLIHGWPGSFYDYHKVIPLLINPQDKNGITFDVVCPSVPGFGFSQSAHAEGFNARDVSKIFLILMERLGYSKFYVQGCDWGCIIASLMARYHPHKILGLHVNMCFSTVKTFDCSAKLMLKTLFPIFSSEVESKMISAFKKKVQSMLEESGYFQMQTTNPNAIGCAMVDSPAGMLAYLLEKSAFPIHDDHLESLDSGDSRTNMINELLTTATIIWVNNNFTASSRFYKENIFEVLQWTHDKMPLTVPSAVAAFPDECFMLSRSMIADLFTDLVSYSVMPKGGHFCAVEEPGLLAEDIRGFAAAVEGRPW